MSSKAPHTETTQFLILCSILSPFTTSPNNQLIQKADSFELIKLASKHLVTPLLHYCVQQKKLHHLFSQIELDYLAEIYLNNKARNQQALHEAQKISQTLKSQGHSAIFLKGLALLLDDTYPDMSTRVIGDIDILLGQDAIAAQNHLLSRGFEELKDPLQPLPINCHHLTPLHNPCDAFSIEIHFNPLAEANNNIVTAGQVFTDRVTEEELLIPSEAHRFIIALMHHEVSDNRKNSHQIDLRHILDCSYLLHKNHDLIQDTSPIFKAFSFSKIQADFIDLLSYLELYNTCESSNSRIMKKPQQRVIKATTPLSELNIAQQVLKKFIDSWSSPLPNDQNPINYRVKNHALSLIHI